ncbi:hypothetical protein [Tsuneonella sp. SYSU-LHT278]|uniref:hypothetical protein n=1 Tax=Tsuneonella sediminis TaxID=3416089 RepID=UPI003F78D86B
MDRCAYRFGFSFAVYDDWWARNPISLDVESYSEAAFARFQRCTLDSYLTELARRCHERLLHAYRLLNPAAPYPEGHRRYGPYVLDRLICPWDRLCVLYRSMHFDAQIDFFDQHRLREERRWRRFIEDTCMTPFTERAEWTRSLLEGVGGLAPDPRSTSLPIEELFDAIIATLKGEDHEHAWLI